jgi:hypothetical protein
MRKESDSLSNDQGHYVIDGEKQNVWIAGAQMMSVVICCVMVASKEELQRAADGD